MKKPKPILLYFLLLNPFVAVAQDCTLAKYQEMIKAAESAVKSGNFEQSIDKLQSAKICRPEKESEVNAKIREVFKVANNLRREAENQRDKAEDRAEKLAKNARFAHNLTRYALAEQTDPTLALRIAEYNYLNHETDPAAALFLHRSLSDTTQAFYQHLLRGHRGQVKAARFSPDGQWVLSCGADSTVRIWDIARQSSAVLRGHKGAVNDAVFTPDGRYVISGGADKMLRVWLVATGKEIAAIDHQSTVVAMDISQAGNVVVTLGGDKKEKAGIWSFQAGALTYRKSMTVGYPKNNRLPVLDIAVSPDGSFLLTGHGSLVSMLSQASAAVFTKAVATADPNQGSRQRPGRSQNSRRSGRGETQAATNPTVLQESKPENETQDTVNVVKWWNIDNEKMLKRLEGFNEPVNAIAFAADGRYVLTSSGATAKLWKVGGGKKPDISLHRTINGHQGAVVAVQISKDGTALLTGSADRTVKLWSLATSELKRTFRCPKAVTRVDFSKDGRFVLAADGSGAARLWNIGEQNAAWKPGDFTVKEVQANGQFAFGIKENQGFLLDLLKKQIRETINFESNYLQSAISPDGKQIALYAGDRKLRLYQGKSIIKTLDFSITGIKTPLALSFDKSQRFLLLATAEGAIYKWELASSRLDTLLRPQNAGLQSAVFSADGSVAAFVHNDFSISVIQLKNIKILKRTDEFTSSIALSEDGRFLLTATDDFTIRLWETGPALALQAEFEGHTGKINSLQFIPGNHRIVSGGVDKMAKLWDIQTRQALVTYAYADVVKSAIYPATPDNSVLLCMGNAASGFYYRNLPAARLNASVYDFMLKELQEAEVLLEPADEKRLRNDSKARVKR